MGSVPKTQLTLSVLRSKLRRLTTRNRVCRGSNHEIDICWKTPSVWMPVNVMPISTTHIILALLCFRTSLFTLTVMPMTPATAKRATMTMGNHAALPAHGEHMPSSSYAFRTHSPHATSIAERYGAHVPGAPPGQWSFIRHFQTFMGSLTRVMKPNFAAGYGSSDSCPGLGMAASELLLAQTMPSGHGVHAPASGMYMPSGHTHSEASVAPW
mmetsp:Transcript_35641/g.91655  ORF Transcript_35641/g.91655 Transcript_35641/m.91655 type:complete len:212 (+) Transcript_35641:1054-1689(+)